MLDAQVYLGVHGIGMGLSVDGVPTDEVVEVPPGVFATSVGLIRTGNGETCEIERNGMKFRTPLLHAILYREGKWWNPIDGDRLEEVEAPAEVWQLWPVYRVEPVAKEGG
jgi:hypothetical protein